MARRPYQGKYAIHITFHNRIGSFDDATGSIDGSLIGINRYNCIRVKLPATFFSQFLDFRNISYFMYQGYFLNGGCSRFNGYKLLPGTGPFQIAHNRQQPIAILRVLPGIVLEIDGVVDKANLQRSSPFIIN